MANYKADITLNERDSLVDMLTVEKGLVKLYATAITEGVSNGFRSLITKQWLECTNDQIKVFFELTENGYCRVQSAPEEELFSIKEQFNSAKHQLC